MAEYDAFMAKIRPLLQAATLVDLDDDVVRLRNALQHLSKVYAGGCDGMSVPANLLFGPNRQWYMKQTTFRGENNASLIVKKCGDSTQLCVGVATCVIHLRHDFLLLCDAAEEVLMSYKPNTGVLVLQDGACAVLKDKLMIRRSGQPLRMAFHRGLGYWKGKDYVLQLGSHVHTVPNSLFDCRGNVAYIVFGKWTQFVEMSKTERMAIERELLAPDAKKTKKKKPRRKPRATDSVALGDTCAQGAELVCPSPPPAETVTPPAPVPPPGVAPQTDDAYCVVCLDEERECAIVPCGHRCLCAGCAARFGAGAACPVCRGDVGAVMRIYG